MRRTTLILYAGSLLLLAAAGLFAHLWPGKVPQEAQAAPSAATTPALKASASGAFDVPSPAIAPAPSGSAAPVVDLTAVLRAVRPMQREVELALPTLDAVCPLGTAFLELTLQSEAGEVLISDARAKKRPEDSGSGEHDVAALTSEDVTDPALVQCIEGSIKGKTLAIPSAIPGRQWQLAYRPTPHGS